MSSLYPASPRWLHVLEDSPLYNVGYTSRGETGTSLSPYDSFNLCHYTGDTPEHVGLSRAMFAEALGIDVADVIVPRQTHSAEILTISSLPVADGLLHGVDGVVTNVRGIVTGVSTADCVPVAAIDCVAGVSGVFHAGWRGAVAGIIGKGIDAMIRLGAEPARIRAFVGPAICTGCFEVGEEVAACFPDEFVVRHHGWRRPHVDLPGYVARELELAGVGRGYLEGFHEEICTRCHPDEFFSARASGIDSGRNFTYIYLKNTKAD
ncbi:MAG: polyphenol oxidase family protein [Staphylococcus sp.]|nr:polyphenol oxidase family protein [Staphylococcus sp.]